MNVVTKKLIVNVCGHGMAGCEYHGIYSQMKLQGNYQLQELDGGTLLDGKLFKAMVATP